MLSKKLLTIKCNLNGYDHFKMNQIKKKSVFTPKLYFSLWIFQKCVINLLFYQFTPRKYGSNSKLRDFIEKFHCKWENQLSCTSISNWIILQSSKLSKMKNIYVDQCNFQMQHILTWINGFLHIVWGMNSKLMMN